MKVTQFSITRYGPLSPGKIFNLGDFNIFYGPNESGKTLTVDALIKLLFQGKDQKKSQNSLYSQLRDFEKIDRVDEKPEGFVVIESDGKQYKLPEKGSIKDISYLNATDFRNIFIIRSSDLSISNEYDFYNNLTDKLVGVHAGDIEKIKTELYKIGAITSTGRFEDSAGTKLKSRLEKAQKIIDEIKQLKQNWNSKNVAELEKELKSSSEEKKQIEETIEKFEKVRKRVTFKKAKSAMAELKLNIENLKPLQDYTEQRYHEMERLIESKHNLESQIAQLESQLDDARNKLSDVINETEQLEKQVSQLNEKKKTIDEELRPAILKIQDQKRDFQSKSRSFKMMRNVSAVATAFFAILVVTFLFLHTTFGAIASAVLLAISISFLVRSTTSQRIEKDIQSEIEKIRAIASNVGIQFSTLDELQEKLNEFSTTFEDVREQLEKARIAKNITESKISDLLNGITANRQRLQETVEELDKITERLKTRTLDELSKKIEERKQIEKVMNDQITTLKTLLGESSENHHENMQIWEQKISTYVEEDDVEELDKMEEAYSEEKLEELKAKKIQIDAKIKEDEDKISKLKLEIHDICMKAREIIEMEEWEYETYAQLEYVQRELEKFVSDAYQRKDDVLFMAEMLDEMIEEEKASIKQLIDDNEILNESFKKITGGAYLKVMYDNINEEKGLKVQTSSGKTLTIDKLSSGTYDQLYLCIRLALGKKLFEQRKDDKAGFFILDDPFVKSDIQRIQNQLSLLKEFALMGWQITYFTSKQEIVQLLKNDIDSGQIKYFELELLRSY